MTLLATTIVTECSACGARTPQRQLRNGAVFLLAGLPASSFVAALALVAAELPIPAAACALAALLALGPAIAILRRPPCERCYGKQWMERHGARERSTGHVDFINVLGECFVWDTRGSLAGSRTRARAARHYEPSILDAGREVP